MAERSTAAVDVAETGGEQSPPAPDGATADGATDGQSGGEATAEATHTGTTRPDNSTGDTGQSTPAQTEQPELHSGHKLARRYRLEECLTRLDGFSSWRAVDEKLRRAVGVHLLPAGHPRARHVLAAARSTALLGDPRFVQVLDAVEESELVYVVHEWLPDATPLSELLSSGPLEPHEAYQLVNQLAQALSSAHREGLAHLKLDPTAVLRTGSGQYRVRGLAVTAALRGLTSDTPQRADTEAIGALLYAALTQRWPYASDAYGLSGLGGLADDALVAPEQVRAGVHRGLSQLSMRALVNAGATASSEDQPCTTPQELAAAVAELPRIRPPEPAYSTPPPFQRTTYQQGAYGADGVPAGATPGLAATSTNGEAPDRLPGRTGKLLKWTVSALLIAALGLGSWQVADALLKGDTSAPGTGGAQENGQQPGAKPLKIVNAKDFDPQSDDGGENPDSVPDAHDGDPSTYWLTSNYYGRPDFGNLKDGVGLILDLGKPQQVSQLKANFMGNTTAEFRAAPQSTSQQPASLDGFRKVTGGSGETLNLKAKKPVKTQYVLLWLTKLPDSGDGTFRGRLSEVEVRG